MTSDYMSKRRFLVTTATATAAICAWEPILSKAYAAAPKGWGLDLSGRWQVAKAGTEDWLPAQVPGCVHTDLMAAGKIPDPYYRENENSLQWVGEADWTYRRTFHMPKSALAHQQVLLQCDGLDTLATIKINGQEIGKADNMFRVWEFDVKSILKPGNNTIEILFSSPLPVMKNRQAERVLYEWAGPHESKGRAWVRKEPCNFGWDWGPVLITCGIWRNIRLAAFDVARLSDVLILQDHSATGRVGLDVEVAAQLFQPAPLKAAVTVSDKSGTIATTQIDLPEGKGRGSVVIPNPKLWWPAGMGEQPLYLVQVDLLDQNGKLIERTSRRIGLRTLRLLEPDKENSLRFEVNGVSFFAKGANYIPSDAFANRVTPELLRRTVADAVAVNMNTLRFWGGGYYEEDALYDLCDEMGICVWLDFKFGCSSYPAFDTAFMENVRLEARDQLRRLRHHPCIAVWCGNNEIGLMVGDKWSDKSMARSDYDKLFKELLGSQVKELAPQANYVSGSPDCGDIHYWEVWHGGKKFEAYRSLTGFPSEFGFQSFPEPRTVHAYTSPEDRKSLTSPVMDWHQRSPKGNEKIRDMITEYFRPPKDFDSSLWLSQIVQGHGIKMGAEYWRQNMPKSMGCVYWQYNDCWPVASWSSVDYYGRWKALHYLARRFYSPLLVSGLENLDAKTVDLFVTSDLPERCAGALSWSITKVSGEILKRGELPLEIGPRQSRKVQTLDLNGEVARVGAANVLVWVKLETNNQVVSENLITFAKPKELDLADPELHTTISKAGDSYSVQVTAAKPALWVWLALQETDARCEDNFIHLEAGKSATIRVQPARRLSPKQFARQLRVRSLFDTYQTS